MGRLFSAISLAAVLLFAVQSAVIYRSTQFLYWAIAGFVPALAFLIVSLFGFRGFPRLILPLHSLSLFGAVTMMSGYVYLAESLDGAATVSAGTATVILLTTLFVVFSFAAGVRSYFGVIVLPPLVVLSVALLVLETASPAQLLHLTSVWVFAVAGIVLGLAQERSARSDHAMRELSRSHRVELEREVQKLREVNEKLQAALAILEREVDERRATAVELEKRAAIDDLTGVYNRRAGLDVLQQSIYLAQRNEQPLTMCFIDVDDLKIVNDNFGHSEGDALLRRVIAILKRHLRKSDYVCRFGGDEFVAVLPNCTKSSAEYIVGRIEEDLAAENQTDLAYRMNISTGFAEFSKDHDRDLEELLKEADNDMYRAKQKKKLKGKK
ncbi:MAG TPA: diguanylate cyclase [Spirochaetia bacterium]|nr:diguanylate cyclase [Spirochaetia bacterium]